MMEVLKKGDSVVMHSCMESAGENNGKIWVCACDQYEAHAGYDVVFLEGFSGTFCCEFLQKINIEDTLRRELAEATKHRDWLMDELQYFARMHCDDITCICNNCRSWRLLDQIKSTPNKEQS
jgi:hypothetical protein